MIGRRTARGRRVYFVYRLLDETKPDREPNRQQRGLETASREAAETLAKYLNDEEAGQA